VAAPPTHRVMGGSYIFRGFRCCKGIKQRGAEGAAYDRRKHSKLASGFEIGLCAVNEEHSAFAFYQSVINIVVYQREYVGISLLRRSLMK